MQENEVLAHLNELTEWATEIVVVVKKDEIRICLDPVNLIKALKREHYDMPTLKDVMTKILCQVLFYVGRCHCILANLT